MEHAPRDSHPRRPLRALALAAAAGSLMGCNRYLLFNQAGYEQAAFANEADILFVVDNSASMADETAALALNFNTFIDTLTSAEGATPVTETLTDAVGNYISYTQQRGRFLDYNLGITTTSVQYDTAAGIQPGQAGTLIGPVVNKNTADVAGAFRSQLLCETAYWADTDVPSDPTYDDAACDAGVQPETISEEYLDCVCGFGAWEDTSQGSGNEEPLEAALLALCRSVDPDATPEDCEDPQSPYAGSTNLTNDDFFREEGTVVVVVVSDEGDDSRRMAIGEVDPTEPYLEPLAEFGKPVKMVTIVPSIDEATGGVICGSSLNPTPPTWSLERLIEASAVTGGFHRNIVVESADGCEPSDFSEHLADLGDLLVNLLTAFQLQSIPDINTIRVWVDGEEIAQSEPRDPSEITAESPDAYSDGWSYDASDNAITFWGTAIPGFNSDVEIFYRPLEAKPRELPF